MQQVAQRHGVDGPLVRDRLRALGAVAGRGQRGLKVRCLPGPVVALGEHPAQRALPGGPSMTSRLDCRDRLLEQIDRQIQELVAVLVAERASPVERQQRGVLHERSGPGSCHTGVRYEQGQVRQCLAQLRLAAEVLPRGRQSVRQHVEGRQLTRIQLVEIRDRLTGERHRAVKSLRASDAALEAVDEDRGQISDARWSV